MCSNFLKPTISEKPVMHTGRFSEGGGSAKNMVRAISLILVFLILSTVPSWAADPIRELRVCADPDNLPFSNNRLEGFENKIVQVIAKEMKMSVQYTWLSQRGSFVGKTLDAGRCDVVMTVPSSYKKVLTTKPYYRSTYVFVYAKDKLKLKSFDDPVLRTIRIGIHGFGEAGTSPVTIALANRGIVDRIVGFSMLNTEESPKAKIIDAVASGDIDVAIVWGPFGSYFANREAIKMEVVPVDSNTEMNSVPFAFDIAMGVKQGNIALKTELESALDRRHDEIRKVLEKYHVPLIALAPSSHLAAVPQSGQKDKPKNTSE
jgi:mxaJ protein